MIKRLAVYLGIAAGLFGTGFYVAKRTTKPDVQYVEKVVEKRVEVAVTQARKATHKTRVKVVEKPDGEKVTTTTTTASVADSQSVSGSTHDTKRDTVFQSRTERERWRIGGGLQLVPAHVPGLGSQFYGSVGRRIFGPVWLDLTLSATPNDLSRTRVSAGVSFTF